MTMMSWVARVAGRTSTGSDIVHHLVIMMTVVVMMMMMAVVMVMMMAVETVMAMIVEIVVMVMIMDGEEILGYFTTVTFFQVN